MFPIKTDDWNRYLDGIFELISNDEAPLYEPKMNAYLEETVAKYLHPSDDYVSLTEIARKYDAANPSYLIQSWLRSRNTVEFLATWERKHNSNFNEDAFQRITVDAKTPQFTLTPKKWIDLTIVEKSLSTYTASSVVHRRISKCSLTIQTLTGLTNSNSFDGLELNGMCRPVLLIKDSVAE